MLPLLQHGTLLGALSELCAQWQPEAARTCQTDNHACCSDPSLKHRRTDLHLYCQSHIGRNFSHLVRHAGSTSTVGFQPRA